MGKHPTSVGWGKCPYVDMWDGETSYICRVGGYVIFCNRLLNALAFCISGMVQTLTSEHYVAIIPQYGVL